MEEHFQSFLKVYLYILHFLGLRKKVKTGLYMPSAAEQMAANLSWNSFGKAKRPSTEDFLCFGSFDSLQDWNIYTSSWN